MPPYDRNHMVFPMERARRFERPTLTLARLCSTPELRPLPWMRWGYLPMREPAREKSLVVEVF